MKTFLFAITCVGASAAMTTPAQAETKATEKTEVSAPKITFKQLDQIAAEFKEKEDRFVFNLTDTIKVGRVKLVPFQTFSGSTVWRRQMIGVSATFKF